MLPWGGGFLRRFKYQGATSRPVHAFSDLATAAYCPRKLYYRRRDDDGPGTPARVERRRALARRYPDLLDPTAGPDPPAGLLAVTPTQWRTNLACARERLSDEAWDGLADPPATDVLLEGREARGIAHKVLEEPLAPSVVSGGDAPETGVWRTDTVRAVAAAKALAWERERPVERAFVEYPARGLIRTVPLTTRRKAAYRETVRRVESIDGPPPRLADDAKCGACEYRSTCGVRTRSLRSLL